MTIEVELGPSTLKALNDLTGILRTMASANKAISAASGEWLPMTQACRAWNISPPTVKKLVQEGKIEVENFGYKNPRYRLKVEDEA